MLFCVFDIYFGSHFFEGPNMVKAMTLDAMAGNEDCPINLVGMEDDASESSVVAVEEKNASTEKNDQEEDEFFSLMRTKLALLDNALAVKNCERMSIWRF